jgi:hypothetical protein
MGFEGESYVFIYLNESSEEAIFMILSACTDISVKNSMSITP